MSERGDDATGDLATGSSAPMRAARSLEQALGLQIRHLRRQRDLTVSELAAGAGLSAGMLSKIENGQISASLNSLQALALALSTPMSALFTAWEEHGTCSFVRAGEGVAIERRGTKVGHLYQLLGQVLGGATVIEPFLITLHADAEPYTGFNHAGVELIYMLTGEVRYRHGAKSYHLRPGDSLLFDSAAPHGPEELIARPMTYLSIIAYQRELS